MKKIDRGALLRGIEAGVDLKMVDETRDASAPLIESMSVQPLRIKFYFRSYFILFFSYFCRLHFPAIFFSLAHSFVTDDAKLVKEDRPRAGLLSEIEKGTTLKKIEAQ